MTLLGTLYLIPNTLGQDESAQNEGLTQVIPPHVLATTAGLEYFVAENAKSTRAFLKLVSASHPLAKTLQEITIAELNVNTPNSALPSLLAPILEGKDAGLISEAGVPAVADPGTNLVRMAHAKGITVKPLVGPSSILLAIMAGGLNGQSFAFNGYLPIDPSQRIKRIKELENRSRQEKQTQSFIETPYRNGALLDALTSTCQPNTMISIATDLTLSSESIKTQTAAKWKTELAADKMPNFHKKPTVFSILGE